jgi:hypothetical protein
MNRKLLAALLLLAPTAARADEVIVVHGDPPRAGLDDLTSEEEADRDRLAALGRRS